MVNVVRVRCQCGTVLTAVIRDNVVEIWMRCTCGHMNVVEVKQKPKKGE